jgi:hypothetical protein
LRLDSCQVEINLNPFQGLKQRHISMQQLILWLKST